MSISDTDRGYAAMFKRLLGSKREAVLTVGVHESEGSEAHKDAEGLTVLDVAAFHEFGLGHNPRRSFIVDWADESDAKHKEQLRKMGAAVASGKIPSTEQALERLGNLYVGEVQQRMVAGLSPELAQETVDRKGSSKPLIDTGQLKSSITYRVGSDK